MKWFILIILTVTAVSCISQAQSKIPVPLLGSKQDILPSEFCKKYKCQLISRGIGVGYVLQLSGDIDWNTIKSFKNSKLLNQAQLLSQYRTVFSLKEERKSKQIALFTFDLRENSKSNFATYAPETVMLADFMYYAVGKRLPLGKSAGESFAPDINDCFFNTKGRPKENIEELTRVMLTGQITTQIGSKKVQYRTLCSTRFEGSTPKMYSPWFSLEIPSMKDLATPSDK